MRKNRVPGVCFAALANARAREGKKDIWLLEEAGTGLHHWWTCKLKASGKVKNGPADGNSSITAEGLNRVGRRKKK